MPLAAGARLGPYEILYQSHEIGRFEVYARPFPLADRLTEVSDNS